MPSVEEILAPIKRLAKEQSEKAKLSRTEELINCLYHDSWVFTYFSNGKQKSIVTDVSFSELKGILEEDKIYLRSLLLELCGGYQDQNQRVNRSSGNAISALKALYLFARSESQPIHLGLWNKTTLEAFFKWFTHVEFGSRDGVSYSRLTYISTVFNKLHRKLIIPIKLSGMGGVKRLVKPIIKSYASDYGFDSEDEFYAEWLKGGSFATVPLEVSMVLLGYSLELLQKDEVKFLESYFHASREFGNMMGESALSFNDFFSFFSKSVLQNGIEKFNYNPKPSHCHKVEQLESRRSWVFAIETGFKERCGDEEGYSPNRFNGAFKSLIENGRKHLNGREKTDYAALKAYTGHIYNCMYVLMLCLTGFRYHEIRNISAQGCINLDTTGRYKLKTIIDKTEAGLIERTVHPLIVDVVELLNNLSYVPKDKDYDFSKYTYISNGKEFQISFQGVPSLFSRALGLRLFIEGAGSSAFGGQQSFHEFGSVTASRMIQKVWKHASARLQPELQARLEEKAGSLTSHGFRHTWVEFVLLNFTDSTDGGVLLGIARNFGYSSKDMTSFLENYITGKFSQVYGRRVETEVTKTLVLRLFGEVVQKAIENPDDESAWLPKHFKGDMATKLALYIREQVEDITIATEYELYELADELVEENLVRIEPNPWGYCILFEDGKTKASCIDSRHDIQKENGGAFELCIKCPNHLIYLPVNEEYLQQTMVTHNQVVAFYNNQEQQIIDFNSPEQRALIIKASEDAIANIQRHLGAA